MSRAVVVLATLVFAFYVVHTIGLPLEQLVKFVPDDAFYYLKIASNITQGKGATFDGITPTSGFHPLFLLLLIPLVAVFADTPEAAVRASVLLCGVLWYVCALAGYVLLKRAAGQETSVIGFCSLLATPSLSVACLGGLETSLSLLLILITGLVFSDIVLGKRSDRKTWLLLGAVAGLGILARTDNVFLIVGLLAAFLVGRRGPARAPATTCWASLLLPSVGLLAAFAAWAALYTGTPFQSSATALRIHALRIPDLSGNATVSSLESSLETAGRFAMKAVHLSGFPPAVVLTLFTSLLLAAALSELSHLSRLVRGVLVFLPLLLHSVFLLLFYSVWLRRVQLWYILPAAVAVVIVCSLALGAFSKCLAELVPGRRDRTFRIATAMLAFVIIMAGLVRARGLFSAGLYPWQPEMLSAAVTLSRHIPGDKKVGAFNAGILGFFLKDRVVNLDGVVNNKVIDHLNKGTLDEYVKAAKLDYIVDYQYSLLRESQATTQAGYPGFELAAELSGTWNGTDIWVCQNRPGESFLDPTIVKPVSGFYPAERWSGGDFDFRWSSGPSSVVSIVASTEKFDRQLVIWAYPLEICGHSGQSVTVLVNGQTYGKTDMRSGWQSYELQLPAGTLRRGQNDITLVYAYTICPAADCALVPDDTRELAVAFRSIRCQRKNRSMAMAAPSSLLEGTTRAAASLTSEIAF